ncbi:MAG TPA: hypothetical protein VKN82_04505 [Desulfohalobiaceae bacterium]|nr:hypothetical protein [Desulfohalobiaceae bacterium]
MNFRNGCDMDIRPGTLVFLTQAYEEYVYKRNPKLQVSLVNRIAKLEEIIDWNSPKGKKIKAAREKSGKWKNLPLEDNKYIFSVYYHDIEGRGGKKGVIERGVPLFSKHPETKELFFMPIPEWIYRDIMKQCESFDVELKENVS